MLKRHRAYAQFTPERIIHWAEKTGQATAKLVEVIISSRPHPQQRFRSCLGILRLAKGYGQQRLEAACQRALAIGAHNYKSVKSILKNGLDRQVIDKST